MWRGVEEGGEDSLLTVSLASLVKLGHALHITANTLKCTTNTLLLQHFGPFHRPHTHLLIIGISNSIGHFHHFFGVVVGGFARPSPSNAISILD